MKFMYALLGLALAASTSNSQEMELDIIPNSCNDLFVTSAVNSNEENFISISSDCDNNGEPDSICLYGVENHLDSGSIILEEPNGVGLCLHYGIFPIYENNILTEVLVYSNLRSGIGSIAKTYPTLGNTANGTILLGPSSKQFVSFFPGSFTDGESIYFLNPETYLLEPSR